MSNLTSLRLAAREIFEAALHSVDAARAVREAVYFSGTQLKVGNVEIDLKNRNVYLIAIGKAAGKMATELGNVLSTKLVGGVISTNNLEFAQVENSQVFKGGHPEPNQESLAAAQAAFSLLSQANAEHALIVFLVSGGGSAMMEWPINPQISLEDLRNANKVLVECGGSIAEINSVRRSFSAVKGGRLAARAPDCQKLTLIISDVRSDEEQNVASGPSLTPAGDAPNAVDVVARYGLRDKLPESIRQALETEHETNKSNPGLLEEHFVLLSNRTALEAAAAAACRLGFIADVAFNISDQMIEEGSQMLMERLVELARAHPNKPVCLISGGEFGCVVNGNGQGGRNQETGLRLARSSPKLNCFAAICAGTDGIDGNSPADGAIVDSTTRARAAAIELDPEDFLVRSDSYAFFTALGDVIATGPTGTNVRDIRILLAT